MLSLSIKDGDGFTVGDDIVIRFRHDEKGRACQVSIQAPRTLNVSRVDNMAIRQMVDRLQQAALRGEGRR